MDILGTIKRRISRKHSAQVTSNHKSAPPSSKVKQPSQSSQSNWNTSSSQDINMPPPAYSAVPAANPFSAPITTFDPPTLVRAESVSDSQFAFLSEFDTIILIDDSGSMAGRSWRETGQALQTITPTVTQFDKDGVDIYFLNHREPYHNVTTAGRVEQIFGTVRPGGATPTGTRLNAILKEYMRDLEKQIAAEKNGLNIPASEAIKPLNIIVITDGVPTDDVESVIIAHAKKLEKLEAVPWQVGVQFFQVGCEPEAAEELRHLDDDLKGEGIRDMVDTVPWNGSTTSGLNGKGILKVVLGAVNKRLDRSKRSEEWRR
ncbi:MAG: hypothetical protein M1834_007383 [Cirrosporium novae-zelandiae]|nr:MAG: hypothetical protein M1834_007383 [Cirrosporium novae-zelandiae]